MGKEESGIGLIYFDKGEESIYYTRFRELKRVLRTYRAMRVLDRLYEFPLEGFSREETTDACYVLSHQCERPGLNGKVYGAVQKIERIFGTDVKEEILRVVPEDLDDVLRDLEMRGIGFSEDEIKEELEKGRIGMTREVSEVMDRILDRLPRQ